MRKPYYWKSHKCWYVTNQSGQKVRLDPDEKKAHVIWAEMQATANPTAPEVPFCVLAELYLAHLKTYVPDVRWRKISSCILSFCEFHPAISSSCDCGRTPVRDLKPYHVTTWIASRKTWKASDTQRWAISIIKACINWAEGQGYIDKSPLKNLKQPDSVPRTQLISEDHHASMMLAAIGAFRKILLALKHSGGRPGTVCDVRLENVNDECTSWTIKKHKTVKKTKKPMVVYLSPCLQTLVRMIRNERNHGPIFLNSQGGKWTPDSVKMRFRALKEKLGLPPTLVPYSYRHTFATTALENGVDIATVAELLGHKNIDMIMRHYGHLDQKHGHLSNAAASVHKKKHKPK